MRRPRTILAALAVGALTAVVAAAPPPARDRREPPALQDLQGVQRLVYSPDGKSLMALYHVPPTGNGALTVGIWDLETGKHIAGMEKVPEYCEQLAFSPDGAKAAGISNSGKQLQVWEATTGKVTQSFALPAWQDIMPFAPFLAFSSDGAMLTSVHKTQVLRAKLGDDVKFGPDAPEKWDPQMTAFAPAADLLVFAKNPPGARSPGSKLLVYDLTKSGDPQTIPLSHRPRSISLTPDGKTLAVAYYGEVGRFDNTPGNVERWDAQAWKVRDVVSLDKRKDLWAYAYLTASPDGKAFAGVPEYNDPKSDIALELFDTEGKVLRAISPRQAYTGMAFSPDGKTMAVFHGNNPLLFIDTATGKDKEP
jgi:WD40 repeat protein